MKHKHTTIEEIIDYLHRELSPEADAAMLGHLSSCPQCAAMYEEQARISESLRAYARATERELPQGVVARIWDAVEAQEMRPTFAQRIAAAFRRPIAIPIAALLVVAAFFFGYSATHRAAPVTTIDAAYYLRDHASLNSTMPFGTGVVDPSSLRDEGAGDQHWIASTGVSVVAESR